MKMKFKAGEKVEYYCPYDVPYHGVKWTKHKWVKAIIRQINPPNSNGIHTYQIIVLDDFIDGFEVYEFELRFCD